LNTGRHRNTPIQVLLSNGVRIEHNPGLTFRSGTKRSCIAIDAASPLSRGVVQCLPHTLS
jgi:hypothetical protein